jgi:hypothetical protein
MADHFNLFFMLDGPLIQGATSGIFYGVNLVDETQVRALLEAGSELPSCPRETTVFNTLLYTTILACLLAGQESRILFFKSA